MQKMKLLSIENKIFSMYVEKGLQNLHPIEFQGTISHRIPFFSNLPEFDEGNLPEIKNIDLL